MGWWNLTRYTQLIRTRPSECGRTTPPRPEAVAACPDYTVEHFGDTRRLADELLAHVLSGRKRATSELVADFQASGLKPTK